MSIGIKEQNIARNEQNVHQNITPMILIVQKIQCIALSSNKTETYIKTL